MLDGETCEGRECDTMGDLPYCCALCGAQVACSARCFFDGGGIFVHTATDCEEYDAALGRVRKRIAMTPRHALGRVFALVEKDPRLCEQLFSMFKHGGGKEGGKEGGSGGGCLVLRVKSVDGLCDMVNSAGSPRDALLRLTTYEDWDALCKMSEAEDMGGMKEVREAVQVHARQLQGNAFIWAICPEKRDEDALCQVYAGLVSRRGGSRQ